MFIKPRPLQTPPVLTARSKRDLSSPNQCHCLRRAGLKDSPSDRWPDAKMSLQSEPGYIYIQGTLWEFMAFGVRSQWVVIYDLKEIETIPHRKDLIFHLIFWPAFFQVSSPGYTSQTLFQITHKHNSLTLSFVKKENKRKKNKTLCSRSHTNTTLTLSPFVKKRKRNKS